MTDDDVVEVSVYIAARPETVFPYFTDPGRYVQWMGRHAPNTVDNFGACHPPCRLCRGGRRRGRPGPGLGCGGGW